MKKKFLAIILAGVGLIAGKASAFFDQGSFYSIAIASDPVIVNTSTYTIDTNFLGLSRVSAQTSVSTIAAPTITFYDGLPSTASITISSNTALQAATSFITLTVTSNTALAPTTAWISVTITSNSALTSARLSFSQGASTWTFIEGVNWTRNNFSTQTSIDFATATAMSIVQAVNFSTYGIVASTGNAFFPAYMSTGTAATVIIRAAGAGSYANGWSVTSSTQFAMVVAYSTGSNSFATSNPPGVSTQTPASCSSCSYTLGFYPGRDGAFITLTTTVAYRFVAGRDFGVDPVNSTGTAQQIAAMLSFSSYTITASTTFVPPVQFLNSIIDPSVGITTGPNTVVIRSMTPGRFANSYVLSSSTQFALVVARSTADASPRLWPGTSNFFEGRDAVFVKVGSQPFVAGIDFTVQSTSSGTAAALSNAIMAVFATSSTVISTFTASAILTATATFVPSLATYTVYDRTTLFTSSQAAVVIGSATYTSSGTAFGYFQGGFFSQIDTTTFLISTGTPNTFMTGMAVLFSTPSSLVAPPSTNLVDGVTYFITAKAPDGSKFGLALTSTGSFLNIQIAISTQAQTRTNVGNAFRLRPVPFNGTTNIKWQRSNDANNWFDVAGTSFTINAATLPNATTYYDFQQENARYLRYVVAASSNTPVTVPTILNGKR